MNQTERTDGTCDPTPSWFREAISIKPRVEHVVVDGVRIVLRRWGCPGNAAPVVLIHGGTAHARWWDHVAPFLVEDNEVVALDLSGHGDSWWRKGYTADRWAGEVLAVAQAMQTDKAPVVVGHSMGGIVAALVAQRRGAHLTAVVIVDSFFASHAAAPRPGRPVPTLHSASDRELMVARFRLVPDAPSLAFTRRHVAWHAVRPGAAGWEWKFDPKILTMQLSGQLRVAASQCPIRVIRGELGDMPPESVDRLGALVGELDSVTTVKGGGHHLMLDRPLELVDALRAAIGP